MTAVRNRLLSFRLDSAPMTSVAFFFCLAFCLCSVKLYGDVHAHAHKRADSGKSGGV